ncbi:hypothetical protein [Nonomuraea angiospora]
MRALDGDAREAHTLTSATAPSPQPAAPSRRPPAMTSTSSWHAGAVHAMYVMLSFHVHGHP